MSRRIRPHELPSGMLAIPCGDMMPTAAARGLWNLQPTMPPGSRVLWNDAPHAAPAKRNRAVGEFLDVDGLDWLLFVDSDVVLPRHTILQLLSHDHGDDEDVHDVVGGLYFGRQPPFFPSGGWLREGLTRRELLDGWHDHGDDTLRTIGQVGGLQEVEWVGGGCMLIRRRVLEGMPEGWFDSPHPEARAEDMAFCLRAREAGFRVFLDTDLQLGHVGPQNIGLGFSVAWSQVMANGLPADPLPRASRESQEARGTSVAASGPCIPRA